MTDRSRRTTPSLREALFAAVVSLAVGAIAAWTAPPVVAAPAPADTVAADPFGAAVTTVPAWIVSPRAARPGEVVHVRIEFPVKPDPATGLVTTPQVLFAFLNDLRHPVLGSLYPAEGTFGVDLVIPPGTDWGADPIVWGSAESSLLFDSPSLLRSVKDRNAVIPFVVSRSAQPPLWNR